MMNFPRSADKRPTPEQVFDSLEKAVEQALYRDWDLMALGGHEQAIAHRIAFYLEAYFPNYNIDCEYNRRKHAGKVYVGERGEAPKKMRPDIIVHRRNTGINILAVEMKANANKDRDNDFKKLRALKADEEGYTYDAIAFIDVLNGVNDIRDGVIKATITWFDAREEGLEEIRAVTKSLNDETVQEEVIDIWKQRVSESEENSES